MSYITMLTVRGYKLANGGYPLIKGLPPNVKPNTVKKSVSVSNKG